MPECNVTTWSGAEQPASPRRGADSTANPSLCQGREATGYSILHCEAKLSKQYLLINIKRPLGRLGDRLEIFLEIKDNLPNVTDNLPKCFQQIVPESSSSILSCIRFLDVIPLDIFTGLL